MAYFVSCLFVCLFVFFAGRHFPPRFPQIFKNNALKILINTNIYLLEVPEKRSGMRIEVFVSSGM